MELPPNTVQLAPPSIIRSTCGTAYPTRSSNGATAGVTRFLPAVALSNAFTTAPYTSDRSSVYGTLELSPTTSGPLAGVRRFPHQRRGSGEPRRDIRGPRREEEQRPAAEDGDADAIAAAREAERELVGNLLRTRGLNGQGHPGPREPGDAGGAGGEVGEEGVGGAGGDGGEGDGVKRVVPVGVVGGDGDAGEVAGGELAGDGVVGVGGALATERVVLVGDAMTGAWAVGWVCR
nr:unnamed protein product [Digitaria exilis]